MLAWLLLSGASLGGRQLCSSVNQGLYVSVSIVWIQLLLGVEVLRMPCCSASCRSMMLQSTPSIEVANGQHFLVPQQRQGS
jgi:hypothetical protein